MRGGRSSKARRLSSCASLGALLVGLVFVRTASAAIPSSERQVLLDLYASTGGSSWGNQSGWNGPAGTECSWSGVGCDTAGAHVTEINLDSNGLSGTLPSLAGLPQLQYCILSNNRLTGSIPAVSSLTGLRILELYANDLTGPIPSLAGLSSLTSLELNSNRLSGGIPSLSSLTSLQVFDLDTNELTGTVPGLSAMTSLQYMALDTNQLSGTFPSLSALTQLSDCELYDNQFTGSVPSLSGLSKLQTLLLANNLFSGAFPDVSGVPLRTLDLDYNALTGPVPSSLGGATTLRNLYFAGNALVGALPASLANLTNLQSGGSDFGYNGLFSTSSSLTSFLDSKQDDGDWQSTQTIAPSGGSAGSATDNAIRFAWTPIAYTADAGSYGIYLSTSSGGPYALAASTSDKSESSITVTGLSPSTTYYAVIRTTTEANANNSNSVTSADGPALSAGTASCGACALSASGLLIEGVSPYPPRASEPNGVLEPGETAPVSPSWTNVSSGSVAGVGGTFSGIAGPAGGGATYTLPKSSANYGTFAAGATRSCGSDCYQVRITADERPAAHWDASVTESLSSGETRTWTLHVGDSFADVGPGTTFYSFVETIFHHGVTLGTGPGAYDPSASTMRDQMAAFISRARSGSDASVPVSGTVPGAGAYDCVPGGRAVFTDVAPQDTFCRHVHFIAANGLTFGCTDGTQLQSTYCPGSAITRRSMAVMLARDLAGGDASVPSSGSNAGTGRSYDCTDGQANAFADVPDSDVGCRYVYYIWSQGIVDGYGDGDYGPDDPVQRDQMSKFLVNAYRLTLYGGD